MPKNVNIKYDFTIYFYIQKVKFNKLIFRTDIIRFQSLNYTEDGHGKGELVTFNNEVTVIAGESSTKVEVLDNRFEQWNSSKIQSVPSEFKTRERRPALVITEFRTDTLFIFGMIYSILL